MCDSKGVGSLRGSTIWKLLKTRFFAPSKLLLVLFLSHLGINGKCNLYPGIGTTTVEHVIRLLQIHRQRK